MQNKPNFMRFSPQNADFSKKQTQFKPNFENKFFQICSLQNAKAADWILYQPNGNNKKSR